MGILELFTSIFGIFTSPLLMVRRVSVHTFCLFQNLYSSTIKKFFSRPLPGTDLPTAIKGSDVQPSTVQEEFVSNNPNRLELRHLDTDSVSVLGGDTVIEMEPVAASAPNTLTSGDGFRNPSHRNVDVGQFCTADKAEETPTQIKRWIQPAPFSKNSKRKFKGRPPQAPTPRMNHFIAFQVSEAKILHEVRDVQEKMMTAKFTRGKTEEPGNIFRDTLVFPATIHFTLHVMELKDDNDKANAILAAERVWKECRHEIEQRPIIAVIRGMDHFNHKVLFAKMGGEEEIQRVTELAEKLKKECGSLNIRGVDEAFAPHMTIAKISKSKTLRRKGITTFPRELWSESEFTDFGRQKVNGIQLLSMQEKDPTGYYSALANFPF